MVDTINKHILTVLDASSTLGGPCCSTTELDGTRQDAKFAIDEKLSFERQAKNNVRMKSFSCAVHSLFS